MSLPDVNFLFVYLEKNKLPTSFGSLLLWPACADLCVCVCVCVCVYIFYLFHFSILNWNITGCITFSSVLPESHTLVGFLSYVTLYNCRRLEKLVKKASYVVGRRLDPLSAVVEQRMRRKLYSVLENNKDPLHSILVGQRSSCSERLISLSCRTERFRRSFVPTAIRLFNSDCWHVLLKFIYLVIDYY